MAISLGSNISSLQAQRRLSDATGSLSKIFEQLSSGLRINRASDDAAGLAISQDLNSTTRVYSKAILNANDGQSLLSIADSTLENLSSVVMRIRELSEQSANGTYSNQQRSSLDAEAQALAKEFFRVSRSASFNGINVFDGSLSSGIRFQLGYGTDGSIYSRLGGSLGTGTITNKYTYAAESTSSKDVAMGDLNGDGILDMVTAGTFGPAGYATVRIGNGDGTFGTAVSYNAESTSSQAVSLGDLNGDGILDLITAGTGGANGFSTIRLGNGNGTFGSATSYQMDQGTTYSVTLGDLNGDGILDLVSAGGTTGSSTTFRLGTGNGTFGAAASIGGGTNPFGDGVLGDLNGDGILDIATLDTGRTGYATIFLGNGNGTFRAGTSYNTGLTAGYGLSLGDLNGDGILDLVATGVGGGAGRSTVQLGTGNGSFGTAVSYLAEGSSSQELSLSDMNGDGILDLVTAGYSGTDGYTTIRLGNGNGSFGTSTSYASDSAASNGVAVGDVNQDGVLDIITAGATDASSGSATIFFGDTRDGVSPILPFSLKTKADALQAMGMLDRTLSNLSSQRGVVGAFQSRLGIALNNLASARDNFTAAESRIKDVDVASASADLIRLQILQKAASAVLAQANQSPQLALQLLN